MPLIRPVFLIASFLMLTLGGAQSQAPANIYGIHTWSNGASGIFSGKRGWTVECVNTANYSFDLQPSQAQQIHDENLELIIRINKEAGHTVPVNPADFDKFAQDCA